MLYSGGFQNINRDSDGNKMLLFEAAWQLAASEPLGRRAEMFSYGLGLFYLFVSAILGIKFYLPDVRPLSPS